MKNLKILNEEDVKDLIAEKFGVIKTAISVEYVAISRGFGMGEHDETEIKISVETE